MDVFFETLRTTQCLLIIGRNPEKGLGKKKDENQRKKY
jgi:hypothetical protein